MHFKLSKGEIVKGNLLFNGSIYIIFFRIKDIHKLVNDELIAPEDLQEIEKQQMEYKKFWEEYSMKYTNLNDDLYEEDIFRLYES